MLPLFPTSFVGNLGDWIWLLHSYWFTVNNLYSSWLKSLCTKHSWKAWSCEDECAVSNNSPFPAGWTSQMGQIAIVDTARLVMKDLTKTFACEVCAKVFKHPDSLRQHHKAHTGETKCPVCYMVMSRKYELRVHLRKRHNIIQWYESPVLQKFIDIWGCHRTLCSSVQYLCSYDGFVHDSELWK
jgi:hypothetical protein